MNADQFDEEFSEKLQEKLKKPRLKADGWNIILLLLLYILQGIPLHLSMAISIVLQKRGMSYIDQAAFSFTSLPFVIKLLWAPIVDFFYSSRVGRRKSWLVPTQYLIGITFIYISININTWIGDGEKEHIPNICMLTVIFLFCNFLAATQDIAVDGWSLTMLQRRNIGHSATCNGVGYILAQFLGYILFIILDSKDFCNKWFRTTAQSTGLISYSNYMYFWSFIFLTITTFILFFKNDNSLNVVEDKTEIEMNVKESYFLFWKILKIKQVRAMCWILLTCKMGFGCFSLITRLKLIDAGISQDNVVLLSVPLIPIKILLIFVVGNFLVGDKALTYFIAFIPSRLVLGTLLALIVFFINYFKVDDELPMWYYILILLIYGIEEVVEYAMSVAGQAFFSRISDPRYGGTYLTLLNTVNNLGTRWPVSLALFLMDILTWKKCNIDFKSNGTSLSATEKICQTIIDGYYVEIFISVIICAIWLIWTRKTILNLEKLDDSEWRVQKKIKIIENDLL